MGEKVEHEETSFGITNDAYDDKGDDGKSGSQPGKKGQTVSTRGLFRFCGKRERFLIIVGTIGAICHGAAFPTMIIFYGQMTESFVQWNICDDMIAQVHCHENATNLPSEPYCSDKEISDKIECYDAYCKDPKNTFDNKENRALYRKGLNKNLN